MQEVFRLQQATPADSLMPPDIVEQTRSLRQRPDAPQRGAALTIRGLRKSYGEHEVLRSIDVHIPAG
jgi:sulfonate transport system ATP-binding protein